MSASKVNPIPLYLGKCLQDLKPRYDHHEFTKQSVAMLCKSAPKILDAAKQADKDGNQEHSYILFMKYLSVISFIQKSDDYKRRKGDMEKILSKQGVKDALNRAEELSKCLEKRYLQQKSKDNVMKPVIVVPTSKQVLEPGGKVPKEASPMEILSGHNNGMSMDEGMSCMQLFKILGENPASVLILDVRPSKAFKESHITNDCCISVPQEIVAPGSSASKLAEKLPPESKSKWNKRLDVDHLILMDWYSSTLQTDPSTPLQQLKTIIVEWDPAAQYRSKPQILIGGYENWLSHYPMCCTNSKPQLPSEINDELMDIDDVTYPELLDDAPKFNRANKPIPRVSVMSSDGVDKFEMPQVEVRPPAVKENGGVDVGLTEPTAQDNESAPLPKDHTPSIVTPPIPPVDRASKGAALQKLKELEDKRAKVIQHSKNLTRDHEVAETELKNLQAKQGHGELTEKARETLHQSEIALKLRIQELQKLQIDKDAENEALRKQLQHLQNQQNLRQFDTSNGISDLHLSDGEKIGEPKQAENPPTKYPKQTPSTPQIQNIEVPMPSMGSNLKRSRSSPNIAQLVQDLDQKPSVPQFDRNTKPVVPKPQNLDLITRPRNFHEVYGTVRSGLTGLKNLGNSCYMNSILQCMSNIGVLTKYFCNGKYTQDLNRSVQNPTRGEVAEEVAYVIRNLWFGQYRSIACRDLKSVVGKYKEQFRGCGQQDAHEFLTFLMDWLHNDLKIQTENHVKEIGLTSDPKVGEADAVIGAIKAWNEFRSKNESFMLTAFFIQQVSTVQCSSCSAKSMNFEEPTSNLTLLLPNASRCSLLECLRLYTIKERISGYKCESCHGHHDAEKFVDLCRLPPILIIHLKRFYSDGYYQKRQTFVDFPLENLDMTEFSPNREQSHRVYDLCGVSNHYGTLEGGHYTAYCKNGAKWHKYDDQDVYEISREDVKSSSAYILFYAAVK